MISCGADCIAGGRQAQNKHSTEGGIGKMAMDGEERAFDVDWV